MLLGVSVYIRLKLHESPVFTEMKAQGRSSKAPLTESFARWDNGHLVLRALFGATAGQGVVWYAGQFYALYFLTATLKVDYVHAYVLVAIALLIGTPFFLLFGRLSDRLGRGASCSPVLPWPRSPMCRFSGLTRAANPALAEAMRKRRSWSIPRVPQYRRAHHRGGVGCAGKITMVSAKKAPTDIDRARGYLNARGIPFTLAPTRPEAPVVLDVGGQTTVVGFDEKRFDAALGPAGYPRAADRRRSAGPRSSGCSRC